MHRSIKSLVAALCLSPTLALADAPAAPPAPAPEVAKTVDAFVGKWTFDGELTMPGQKPVKMTMPMDCTKTAGGRAVSCHGAAKKTPMGPIEESALVAYNEGDKKVHFMAVTSMGEVHDHQCTWKDDKTFTCEPLKDSMQGKPITEDITMTWTDGKTAKLENTVTMADGSKMTMTGNYKKK